MFRIKSKENDFEKVNDMQSRIKEVTDKNSSQEFIREKEEENRLKKDRIFYSNHNQNLWDFKPWFCKKQLKLYHDRVKTINDRYETKMTSRSKREAKHRENLKRFTMSQKKAEAKQRLLGRRMERLALQKVSGQYVGNTEKPQAEDLTRIESANMARRRFKKSTDLYLRKSDNSWSDYRDKSAKHIESEFTPAVLEGEDKAVKMINKRIDDNRDAQEFMRKNRRKQHDQLIRNRKLISRSNYQKKLGLSRKIHHKIRPQTAMKRKGNQIVSDAKMNTRRSSLPAKERENSKLMVIENGEGSGKKLKQSESQIVLPTSIRGMKSETDSGYLGKGWKDIDGFGISRTKSNLFYRPNLALEPSSKVYTKMDKARRIDYCEEFRGMPVRDAGARAYLVGDDNRFLSRIRTGSEYGRLIRGNKRERAKGRKSSDVGLRRVHSAQKGARSESQTKRRFNRSAKKRPYDKYYLSRQTQAKAELRPMRRDSVCDTNNLESLENETVSNIQLAHDLS